MKAETRRGKNKCDECANAWLRYRWYIGCRYVSYIKNDQ